MHEADVDVNGKHIYKHLGGYFPFYIDVSDVLNYGNNSSILIKLNNQDNGLIPPGKPIKDLDFNFYNGIYRNAWFLSKNKLYITNVVAANRETAGGIMVHYEAVTNKAATIVVKTEISNDAAAEKQIQIRCRLVDKKW